MTRTAAIVNPAAGGYHPRKLAAAVKVLRRHCAGLEVWETSGPGDGTRLARKAAAAGFDTVYAVGGDGTLSEAVGGLLGTDVALGTIPLGTVCVLAREIGLSRCPEAAAEALVKGRRIRVRPGVAGSRCFLLMAGMGFDAEAVYGAGPKLKSRLGRTSYVLSGLRVLLSGRLPELSVRANGRTYRAASVIVSRARLYAGGHVLAPEADLRRPELSLRLFAGGTGLQTLRYCMGVACGVVDRFGDTLVLTARDIEVTGPPGVDCHVQADGDYAGRLPMTVCLAEAGVSVLVPSDWPTS